MIVLWVSRHEPLASQRLELARLYGNEVDLVIDPAPFGGADDIIQRVQAASATETVVVAPLSVIAALCARGLRPLRAEMLVCAEAEAETMVPGNPPRHYRFDRFTRIVECRLVAEELQ